MLLYVSVQAMHTQLHRIPTSMLNAVHQQHICDNHRSKKRPQNEITLIDNHCAGM